MSNSIRPLAQAVGHEVVKEASSTKFSVSILLLAALMGGMYWLGRDSTQGISKAQVETLIANNNNQLILVTEALKAQATLQSANAENLTREVRAVGTDVRKLQADHQVTQSYVVTGRR